MPPPQNQSDESANLSLVDPELREILANMPTGRFSAETLPGIRNALASLAAASSRTRDSKIVENEVWISGPQNNGTIRCRTFRPSACEEPLPVILDLHGGGYVSGSPELTAPRNRKICAELDCLVVAPAYRLAPETAYPGALEDCYAALSWLYDNATSLRVDQQRICVAGESAGGGLAAALCLMSRDRGEIPIASQHLTYPMLDDRTCRLAATHASTGRFVWTSSDNRFGWASLLGEQPGGPGVSPYAAAARAIDLSMLPPAFISVGDLDLFLEESMDYACRLARAGVPVEMHVYPGAFHGFRMAAQARVAVAAERDSLAALRRALRAGKSN